MRQLALKSGISEEKEVRMLFIIAIIIILFYFLFFKMIRIMHVLCIGNKKFFL